MFNDIIVSNFSNPQHAIEINDATHAIELGNPVCGDRIRVQLRMDGDKVVAAGYQAWGCATSLATGNVFCEQVNGKSLQDIGSIDHKAIDAMLGELDPSQHHCLEMLRALFGKLHETIPSAG